MSEQSSVPFIWLLEEDDSYQGDYGSRPNYSIVGYAPGEPGMKHAVNYWSKNPPDNYTVRRVSKVNDITIPGIFS